MGAILFLILSSIAVSESESSVSQRDTPGAWICELFHGKIYVSNRVATVITTYTYRNTHLESQQLKLSGNLSKWQFLTDFHVMVDGKRYNSQIVDIQEARRKYQSSMELSKAEIHVSGKESMQFGRWTEWHIKVNSPAYSIVNISMSYQELVLKKKMYYGYIFMVIMTIPTKRTKIEAFIKEKRPLKLKRRDFLSFYYNNTEEAQLYIYTPEVSFTQPSPETFTLENSEHFYEYEHLSKVSLDLAYELVMEVGKSIGDDFIVEDGYFVHLISAGTLLTRVSIDFVFVMDVSSHANDIPFYKLYVEDLIGKWFSFDRFSVILYSSHVCVMRPLLLSSLAARIAAGKDVKSVKIGGGADINNALIAAMMQLNSRKDMDRPGIIVLFSAGPATEGEKDSHEIIKNVAKLNRNNAVLIFNIDYMKQSDNDFVTDLTFENNGFSIPIDSIKGINSAFFQIRDTFAMTDLKVTYFNNSVDEKTLTKTSFSFLARHSCILICGRVKENVTTMEYGISGKALTGPFNLKSKVKDLKATHWTGRNLTLLFPSKFNVIEKMWAMTTIIQLQDRKKIAGKDEEVRATETKILDLSLKYSFVTPMTALVLNEPLPGNNGAVKLFVYMNINSANFSDKSDASVLDISWQNETSMDLLNSCSPILDRIKSMSDAKEIVKVWYTEAPNTTAFKLGSLSVWDRKENIYRGICVVPGQWPFGKVVLLHSTDLFLRVVVGMCTQHRCRKGPRPDLLVYRTKSGQILNLLDGERWTFAHDRAVKDIWEREKGGKKLLFTYWVKYTVDEQASVAQYEIHLVVYPDDKDKKNRFGGVLGNSYWQAYNDTLTGNSEFSIATSCKNANPPPQVVNITKPAPGFLERRSTDLQLLTFSVGKYHHDTFKSICLSPKLWRRAKIFLIQKPSVFGVNIVMCEQYPQCKTQGSTIEYFDIMWYQKELHIDSEFCARKIRSRVRNFTVPIDVKGEHLNLHLSIKVACALDAQTFEPRFQMHVLMYLQSGIENLPWNFEGLLSYLYSRHNSIIVEGKIKDLVPEKCKDPKHQKVVTNAVAKKFKTNNKVSIKDVDLITFSVRHTHSNKSKSICLVPMNWFCGNVILLRKARVLGIYLKIGKKYCRRCPILHQIKIKQHSKTYKIKFDGWKYEATESVKIWDTDENKPSQKRLFCTTTVNRSLGIKKARPKYQIHIILNLQPGDGDVAQDFKGLLADLYSIKSKNMVRVSTTTVDCKDAINQQVLNKPVG